MHRITAFLATAGLLALVTWPFLDSAPPARRGESGRRVFSWEDPEGIAAFVDPRDPAVLAFVRTAWTSFPVAGPGEFPPRRISTAASLLACLAARGLRELPDPPAAPGVRPGEDQVSSPSTTLLTRAGDCEDLSVLACSVLEAVHIPTAMAIADDHVFFLIDSGIAAAELPASPLVPDTVILNDGRVWLPIEATELARPGAGFAAAWRAAWSWCGPRALELTIIDLQRAWKRRPPSGSPPGAAALVSLTASPSGNGCGEAAAGELASLDEYFAANVASRLDRELAGLEAGPGRERALAAAYAHCGLFRPARRSLEGSLAGLREEDPTRAALLADLGLVLALGARSRADLDEAVRRLSAGLAALPARAASERADVLARLALVHQKRGDLERERASLAESAALDPAAAARYRDSGGLPSLPAGGTSMDE